ncbi:MAG: hypothetical protein QNL14_15990 [Deltaproteobacteria bacterium]|nr:hypothetical protein [Deltaproteobacteria bacterium]
MSTDSLNDHTTGWLTLAQFPVPAKALISSVILTIMIAMAGALGQIVIHDILPTFFAESKTMDHRSTSMEPISDSGSDIDETSPSKRGDLFSDDASAAETSTEAIPFYKTEQFVWTLKWTHIHLFGMNMIFIFMGVIAIFLDVSTRCKTLLVVTPFAGVLIDIATMWLKAFVSPAFFWLHIPGGALFGFAFFYVSIRAVWEMWWVRKNYASR